METEGGLTVIEGKPNGDIWRSKGGPMVLEAHGDRRRPRRDRGEARPQDNLGRLAPNQLTLKRFFFQIYPISWPGLGSGLGGWPEPGSCLGGWPRLNVSCHFIFLTHTISCPDSGCGLGF